MYPEQVLHRGVRIKEEVMLAVFFELALATLVTLFAVRTDDDLFSRYVDSRSAAAQPQHALASVGKKSDRSAGNFKVLSSKPIDIIDADFTVSIPRDDGGRFTVQAMLNDVPVDFRVDTGSDLVILTGEDASQLNGLKSEGPFQITVASGDIIDGEKVVIPQIRIGMITVEHVEAFVLPENIHSIGALLGLDYLTRLRNWGYSKEKDEMSLKQ